ncbi:uncharacterized protein LOC104875230 [Fukomys damarensis]|uniref:uncharacterized protein LOC104875230 n=1 Tax=Fukomys damarensis TaxID=885580 RepID=UPI0005402489|nr:uncharacterized protein LOC104875230 [Fukomys damarensis]
MHGLLPTLRSRQAGFCLVCNELCGPLSSRVSCSAVDPGSPKPETCRAVPLLDPRLLPTMEASPVPAAASLKSFSFEPYGEFGLEKRKRREASRNPTRQLLKTTHPLFSSGATAHQGEVGGVVLFLTHNGGPFEEAPGRGFPTGQAEALPKVPSTQLPHTSLQTGGRATAADPSTRKPAGQPGSLPGESSPKHEGVVINHRSMRSDQKLQ